MASMPSQPLDQDVTSTDDNRGQVASLVPQSTLPRPAHQQPKQCSHGRGEQPRCSIK